MRNELSTVVYAILIPLIICTNMLVILGLIKTKRSKFVSSQILFLTLFMSDLTFGVVQLPTQIYILWKSGDPTCFEIKLGAFSMVFPMCMSGNILCLISVDRYINIVRRKYYKKTSKKTLAIYIILVVLISFMWAAFEAHFKAKLDIKKHSETLLCSFSICRNSNGASSWLQCCITKICKTKKKKFFHKSKWKLL